MSEDNKILDPEDGLYAAKKTASISAAGSLYHPTNRISIVQIAQNNVLEFGCFSQTNVFVKKIDIWGI